MRAHRPVRPPAIAARIAAPCTRQAAGVASRSIGGAPSAAEPRLRASFAPLLRFRHHPLRLSLPTLHGFRPQLGEQFLGAGFREGIQAGIERGHGRNLAALCILAKTAKAHVRIPRELICSVRLIGLANEPSRTLKAILRQVVPASSQNGRYGTCQETSPYQDFFHRVSRHRFVRVNADERS